MADGSGAEVVGVLREMPVIQAPFLVSTRLRVSGRYTTQRQSQAAS